MRFFAVLVLVTILGIAPASAWQEFVYLDRGFAIQFQGRPQITAGIHKSTLIKDLRTSIYTNTDDNVLYRMTVVELGARADAGNNLLNEAAYFLMREGEVLFTDFPRVYQDEKAVYGVTLVVDRMDGTRARTSLYVNKGRLYIIDAIVLPARGDKDMTTPSRFDQTVRFPPDGRFD
ncbi:MAG: hypothetical protein EXR00_05775 [Alphaproteobacteria bacterium]|nr:hypothetical protein [Alphaproteobacteria bacterium]